MPLKIVTTTTEKLAGDGDITKTQIEELHLRYKNNTGKIRKGKDEYDDFDKTKHTCTAWFPLSEIMAFLRANGVDLSPGSPIGEYGIRVFFGMHHMENSYQPKPQTVPVRAYDYHDTPIFVLTKKNGTGKNEDQLNESNFVSLAPTAGMGMDNAQLCPPECNP